MNFLKPSNVVIFDSPNRDAINKSVYGESDVMLGRGAYGIVIRALYKKRNVAVKIIEKANDFKFNSLKRESNIVDLEHENIIKIMKIVYCKTYGALIMERFEGKTLQNVLNTCRIDLIHRLFVLSDISSALSYCHSMGIIHCDVKPQNIFIAVGGKSERAYICKLFDFGCSLHVRDCTPYEPVCGTFLYSAPEILQNLRPKCCADIFSLGIIMWQLKEYKIPYGAIHEIETIIWNVVKNNLRPDSCASVENPKVSIRFESPYQRNKMNDTPLKRKSYKTSSENIPKIFVDKSGNLSSQKKFRPANEKRKSLEGRKLFESNVDGCDEDEDREMNNLFIDHCERLQERVSMVEDKFVKLYQQCWHQDEAQRYSASEVTETLHSFIKLLEF